MLQIKRLGIYDSGLGGFSVYKALKDTYPHLDMVLFADQDKAPFGNKSVEEIKTIAHEAMFRFQQQGIDSILIACNTVSAVALDYLRESFPEMNLWGIIDLTVSQVPQGSSVGVVSTQATHESQAYAKALEGHDLVSCPLPELVTCIESLSSDEEKLEAMKCDSVYNQDYLILGCTHYPIVMELFESLTKAKIIDSIQPILEFIDKLYLPGNGITSILTSKDPENLELQILSLFNHREEVLSWSSLF